MGILKILGGIAAIFGSSLVIITAILAIAGINPLGTVTMDTYISGAITNIMWPITAILLGTVVLIGGILGLAGKRAGGILPIIVGALWFVGYLFIGLIYFMPMSFFAAFFDYTIEEVMIPIFVESLIVIAGGALILAGGE